MNKAKLFWIPGICIIFLLIYALAGTATGQLAVDECRPEIFFDSPLSLTWKKIGNGILEPDICFIAVNPLDPFHVFAATSRSGYQSFDGGKNFSPFLYIGVAQQGISDIFFEKDGNACIFIAGLNGLLRSCSLGADWEEIFNIEVRGHLCYSVLTDSETIYLGTSEGLFFRKKTEPSWHRMKQIPSGKTVFHLDQDSRYFYIAFSDEVYRVHKKTHQVWQIFSLPLLENDVDLFEDDQEQDNELFHQRQILFMSFVDYEENTLFLLTQEGIFLTRDRGDSWNRLPDQGLPSTRITSFIKTKESNMVIGTARGVFGYFNGSWRQIYQGIETGQINGLASDGRAGIYVATDQGIFKLMEREKASEHLKEEYFDLKKIFDHEPSINQVHDVAIQYAEVSPDKIKNWRRQAQQRGWLPNLSIGLDGYDRVTTADRVWGSHTSGGQHYVGPESKTFYENLSWSVRFSWNLGDLIWSSAQTSIDTRSKLMVELREKILNEATRVYFERRRLQIEIASFCPKSMEYLQGTLRIQELTAFLDAFTGGWFSDFIQNKR